MRRLWETADMSCVHVGRLLCNLSLNHNYTKIQGVIVLVISNRFEITCPITP